MRAWVTWWVLLAALYLVLADNTVWPELAVGAFAASVGATGAVLVRRHRLTLLHPQLRWLRGAWRPLLGMVTDFVPLARALLTRREGTFVEIAVQDDPAYHALIEALGCLAPNTLVVDVDGERALLHQLIPSERPRVL